MSARSYTTVCLLLISLIEAMPIRAQDSAEQAEHQHHTADAPAASATSIPDDTTSEAEHVAPEPPQHVMGDMSYDTMTAMMQMDDRTRFGRVLFDQLEWRGGQGRDATAWEAQAWYGGDYHKLWLKTEGERLSGVTEDARAELLWDRIFARWWSLQAGVRRDFGAGPGRTWAAFGLQGLAPYWFEIEATAYVGEQGRTVARLQIEYDVLFTQRLVLQPAAELNFYGRSDPERGIGSGLADLDLGLRLRYEIRREFAPYAGVTWTRRFGETADLARASGNHADELHWAAGLRIWF